MADSKVAVIAGYGIGISAAVARRFGSEGYKLALLARTQSRLDAAVAELAKSSITAKAYATDLANAAAVKAAIAAVHNDLGPISVLHWNAYGQPADILTVTPELLQAGFDISVTGLVAAVQAAHTDLKTTKGTVLVTGGYGVEDDAVTQAALNAGAATLGVAKAAQRKLTHILSKQLSVDGIYVADLTVLGAVHGTAFDPDGTSSLTAHAVAEEFWGLAVKRDPAVWSATKAAP